MRKANFLANVNKKIENVRKMGEKMKTEREERLVKVHQAIRDGKAFTDTGWGRMLVIGYNDNTGWMQCKDGSATRSFMTTLEGIIVQE